MDQSDYLIVGGGLATAYAVASIRQKDTAGTITIVSEERHVPYDRVPLSKGYLMGKVKRESLFPKKTEFYREQNVTLVNGRRATSVDLHNSAVRLDDESGISYKKLLLATGGRPRRLTIPGSELRGIFYFRTLDDCDAIREQIGSAQKAVIIGGGFIGCELAAAFKMKGLETTILEAASSILKLAFDSATAQWVERYFVEKGVNIITNCSASEFVGEGERVRAVKTADGRIFPADFVVVGVGIVQNTELAEQAGLKVDKGILVNEFLETESPGVFAAGDVARFYHPVFRTYLRVEHYDVAVKQGRFAGFNMAGERRAFIDMPYFFSYMFGLTINAYGDMSKREIEVRRGELGNDGFLQFFFADGKLRAFLSVNRPHTEVEVAKKLLTAGAGEDQLRLVSDRSRRLEEFIV